MPLLMAHALLSPSAAHRWLSCTPSAVLESREPDAETDFALEGTLAHAVSARKLKQWLGEDHRGEDEEIAALWPRFGSGEMDEYTDEYVSIVLAKLAEAQRVCSDARLLVERRVEFGDYAPGSFGTADAVIIADGVMDVVDFKYGKGVRVDAERNPQMMLYGLGAYMAESFAYNIASVRMTIVQPRIGNVSSWEISAEALEDWAEYVLKPKAMMAARGEGDAAPGEWCRFCRVKGKCRALASMCLEVASSADARLLSPDEMAHDVLPRLATIKSWIDSVESLALESALSGTRFDGYKIVEGRSVRRFSDPLAVREALLRAGYNADQIDKPLELRGITELERLVGKKLLAEMCGEWLVKPKGKPTLVPVSDKRPPYNPAADDFTDF